MICFLLLMNILRHGFFEEYNHRFGHYRDSLSQSRQEFVLGHYWP